MMASNIPKVRDQASRLRRVRWAAYAFGLTIGLISSPSVGQTESGNGFWSNYLMHASRCEAALNDTLSEGTRCLFGNGLKLALEQGLRVADAYGKKRFGGHFQVAGDLRYHGFSDKVGIEGDIDMVLPFTGGGTPVNRQGDSSFFLQQGITRSWDGSGSGLFRNDLRYGLVRRFRLTGTPDGDILGLSVFHLLNTEYGHRVLVPSVDYTGRWGTGSIRYFVPTTGWRPARPGYEERAIDGIEVGVRFDLTSTIRVKTVGYRWRAKDGSSQWDTGARMDFKWRPHPWFEFGVGYDGIGHNTGVTSLGVTFRMPFGRQSGKERWEGLGIVSSKSQVTTQDLWRPVENIGSIRVATRKSAAAAAGKVKVRFLQDTVGSGGEVQLEVYVTSPALDDISVEIRLVPGSGTNPAVAGVDFVEKVVETTIAKGTTRSTVSVTLLQNDSLQKPRTLGVTLSVAS